MFYLTDHREKLRRNPKCRPVPSRWATGARRGPSPALAVALNDREALVRGAAAWALGRIPGERSVDALRARRMVEEDEGVVSEIESSFDED